MIMSYFFCDKGMSLLSLVELLEMFSESLSNICYHLCHKVKRNKRINVK